MGLLVLIVGGIVFVAVGIASVRQALKTARFNKTPAGALVLAAKRGDIEGVKTALAGGAEINGLSPSRDKSALHQAAIGGHIDIVRLLLDRGAEINVAHSSIMYAGNTPSTLILTIENGHVDIADVLLTHGARVAGGDLLYAAAIVGGEKLVSALLARGANPEEPCGEDVHHGFCSDVVKQVVTEAFGGAAGTCNLCNIVSSGVSRDFVIYRVVSRQGTRVTTTTRTLIDTRSFFVCSGCVDARVKALHREREKKLAARPSWAVSWPRLAKFVEKGLAAPIPEPLGSFYVIRAAQALPPESAKKQALLAQQTLLSDLAQRWFDQAKASFGQGSFSLTSAEEFKRWVEISRVKRSKGIM